MVITALTLTPAALGIGVLLKHSITQKACLANEMSLVPERAAATPDDIKDLSTTKGETNMNLED